MECSFWQTYNKRLDRCVWSDWTWLLIWIIMNCSPLWITYYTNKHMRPQKSEAEKYKPFVRNDYDKWSYLLGLFSHFFFLPRCLTGWTIFLSTLVPLIIYTPVYCMIGRYDRRFASVIQYWAPICSSFGNSIMGIFPIVKRVECDYSEWLGPDYQYTYEGAGINI